MVKKIAFYCIPEIMTEKEWDNLIAHGRIDESSQGSSDWGNNWGNDWRNNWRDIWRSNSTFAISGVTEDKVKQWYKDIGKDGVNEMTQQIKAIRQSVMELSKTKFFGEFDVPADIIRLIINFTFSKR